MTVAQLVHPALNFARHSRPGFFRSLYQSAAHHAKGDADLWRSIAIGMGFAAAGFALMASALAA